MLKPINKYFKKLPLLFPVLILGGCNASFHDLGIPPNLTAPVSQVAVQSALIKPESLDIRGPQRVAMVDNAIWNKREAIYFRDRRAYAVGDILTIRISMNDSAKLSNRSGKDTTLSGSLTGAGTYSYPNIHNPSASIEGALDANLDAERGGSVIRKETIKLQLAAVVIDASPNGNLQIEGTQEVRVNHELRILTVQGVVRSKDILPDNTIAYEKIAEARISYGGINTRANMARKRPLFSQNSRHNSMQEKSL